MRRRRKSVAGIEPLTVSVERTVRFEEVDPLGIMWHGRYASWLEDGREALGKRYGIHYLDFHILGVEVPLKTYSLDFRAPLRYGETYRVNTSLLWNEAALLEYAYTITDGGGMIMTTGSTIQLMVTGEGSLLLDAPDFYKAFCLRWREGEAL